MTLPADWPRDMAGCAKAPKRPIMEHLDVNGRRRELARWIDMVPEPAGGWRGRDKIAHDAIRAMVVMFAPLHDMGSSAWWCIEDALAALVQMVELDSPSPVQTAPEPETAAQ